MALLPSWGAMVANGVLNLENIEKYAAFVANRYKDAPNVIWLLGGDIRGGELEELYDLEGKTFKHITPDKLVGYHPFGRISSSVWFHDAEWLDFNMFQSGHRRYDQASLGPGMTMPLRRAFWGRTTGNMWTGITA